MKKLLPIVAFVAMFVGTQVFGEPTLKGVRLGEHCTGPKVSPKDFTGRVVVFEYWGVNCGPCISSIPHISELQAKYGRNKLVVIANHAQNASAAQAANVWKKHAVNDSVSVINRGSLPGASVSGIPAAFVFDHQGKLVFKGHPAQMDTAVASAVKKAPGFLTAGMEYTVFKREAKKLGEMRKSLSSTMRKLRKAAEDSNAKGHNEAKYLVGRVNAWTKSQYELISAAPSADPVVTESTISQMKKLFYGDELSKPFVELSSKLKKDKTYQNEKKAIKYLKRIESKYGQYKTTPSGTRTSKVIALSIKRDVRYILKRYPDTNSAKKAQAIADKL